MDTIPETDIEALLARYDGLLLDAYGVLFHETGALPGASALTRRLQREGRPWYVLTNDASKLPETASRRWAAFGVEVPMERILTAGGQLAPWFAREGLVGARCAVLGTRDSEAYVRLAGGEPVGEAEDFDVLVIGDGAGYDFMPTVDAAFSSLCRGLDGGRPVRLVVPNPDKIYPSRNGYGIASGAIATLLETALEARYGRRPELRFESLGKPRADMYIAALARAATRNVVMVGDTLATDIVGARSVGLDAAWVCGGATGAGLGALESRLRPTWRLSGLG